MEIFNRSNKRSVIKRSDRIFFSLSKRLLNNWKEILFVVKPETVIKWHRQGFNLFWRIKSKHKGGRGKIDFEARKLIIQIAKENSSWGIPRIVHVHLLIREKN